MEVLDTKPTLLLHAEFDFSDADSSIVLAQNDTRVLACIDGPAEQPMAKRLPHALRITVHYTKGNGVKATLHDIDSFITRMIDTTLYPRAGLVVTIHTLHDSGSSTSAAFNAVSLALLDAGVPLHDLFVGVDVALLPDGTTIVGPNTEMESTATAQALVVYKADPDGVVPMGFRSRGSFTPDFYAQAVHAGSNAAADVFVYLKQAMSARLAVSNVT